MNSTPTYLPCPNWDIPADSDMVVLGRLIKDPQNPQSKVPMSSDNPIPPGKIFEGEKTDWETTLKRLRSGSIGLWAQCLQFIGGQLSFTKLKSAMEHHHFNTLETHYFLPDDEYLAEALRDAGVQAYLDVTRKRKPVYLITGIKIARGASMNRESNNEISAQGALKGDTTTGVEAGLEAKWESKKKEAISYGGSTDYIFAYQLLKMTPKKNGTDSSNKSYVKGALFGRNGNERDDVEMDVRNFVDVEEEVSLGFSDTWERIEEGDRGEV